MGTRESDSDTELLIAHCGSDRPLKKAAERIVQPSPGNDFVTIRDYASGKSASVCANDQICFDDDPSCISLAHEPR